MVDGYDIIGDVHGHADALKELLKQLGYNHTDGAYRHPGRMAVFVGDLIDRGCQNRETIAIVRDMWESETAKAVMGNHEYNTICFHTGDKNKEGENLRPWNKKNVSQHMQFLCEFSGHQTDLDDAINWFKELPLFLEIDGFRVVHACWHKDNLNALREKLPDGIMTEDFLIKSSDKSNNREYRWIENILKGPECRLPDDNYFLDKDGHSRKEVRVKWWLDEHASLREAAWAEKNVLKQINPDENTCQGSLPGYHHTEPPVFFGHYWCTGKPAPITDNIACLDYSVAKGGNLCAYRWDGEDILDGSKYIFV